MSKEMKRFAIELYDNDDIEVKNFVYEKETEQLEKYYHLLNKGYKKSQVIKKLISRLEDC